MRASSYHVMSFLIGQADICISFCSSKPERNLHTNAIYMVLILSRVVLGTGYQAVSALPIMHMVKVFHTNKINCQTSCHWFYETNFWTMSYFWLSDLCVAVLYFIICRPIYIWNQLRFLLQEWRYRHAFENYGGISEFVTLIRKLEATINHIHSTINISGWVLLSLDTVGVGGVWSVSPRSVWNTATGLTSRLILLVN